MSSTKQTIEVALASARATVATLELALASLDGADDRGDLVTLRDGALGLSGDTLVRWARTGRLAAFEAERGRLVAWERDVRRAVESAPCTQRRAPANDVVEDPFAADLAAGRLVEGRRG